MISRSRIFAKKGHLNGGAFAYFTDNTNLTDVNFQGKSDVFTLRKRSFVTIGHCHGQEIKSGCLFTSRLFQENLYYLDF